MNELPQHALEKRLSTFRDWAREHSYERCRLVHYCGFEFVNAIDVPVGEVEQEILGCLMGCLYDGLEVNWKLNGKCLVIALWESWDFPLDWQCIFEERDFDLTADD